MTSLFGNVRDPSRYRRRGDSHTHPLCAQRIHRHIIPGVAYINDRNCDLLCLSSREYHYWFMKLVCVCVCMCTYVWNMVWKLNVWDFKRTAGVSDIQLGNIIPKCTQYSLGPKLDNFSFEITDQPWSVNMMYAYRMGIIDFSIFC